MINWRGIDFLMSLLKEKHRMTDDEIIKEMNSVMIAVDEALADVQIDYQEKDFRMSF